MLPISKIRCTSEKPISHVCFRNVPRTGETSNIIFSQEDGVPFERAWRGSATVRIDFGFSVGSEATREKNEREMQTQLIGYRFQRNRISFGVSKVLVAGDKFILKRRNLNREGLYANPCHEPIDRSYRRRRVDGCSIRVDHFENRIC